jgi:hypothetical protein
MQTVKTGRFCKLAQTGFQIARIEMIFLVEIFSVVLQTFSQNLMITKLFFQLVSLFARFDLHFLPYLPNLVSKVRNPL